MTKPEAKKASGKNATYRFTIRHIARADADRILTVYWKGDSLGSKKSGKKSWLVPSRKDFKVLEIAANDPSCIQVRFSDRIDPAQDLRGLVRTGNGSEINVRYNIDSNVLKVYSTDGWTGGTGIKVLQGIKSTSGKTLKIQTSAEVNSAWEIPSVKFATDGVILPPNDGVIVPIETKNLRGLIVEAYQIYGKNILQFLQVNELDGDYELRRVGEPIWSKAFDFSWDDSMKNRGIPRGLDLSDLIKKHPDGMYQLRLTFRKRHIIYECPATHQDFSSLPMPSDDITDDKPNENSYWDYYGDMSWDLRRTYWEYENDPCHPAFYMSNYNSGIVVKKNVLVSNLGILTKKDQDGSFYVTVADLASTVPVADADIALYSFAQKELARAKTGANGTVKLPPSDNGYFITATKGGQTSYLRIDDGTSLSVSHFEVDGEKAAKGIKGFIYGERGVWRPGDDIHLVFVLQDLAKQLPANFPVTFELQDPMGRIARSGVYSDAVDGFYRIDTSTGANDPTGPWIARIKAGGQTWTKNIKIEMIVPNRLSINLKTSQPYLVAENNPFTLSGAWLSGAKAPGFKADVTAKAEAVIPKTAVFASNTSTLPITGLAKASKRPKSFIGIHFFSPVEKMPLVEIIVGKQTSDEAIARALDYVGQLKKTPIVVNDSRGFYTSRCFGTYTAEGAKMLSEGIDPQLIESAGKLAGMPVGPLAVSDEVSLELAYKVMSQSREDLGAKYKEPVSWPVVRHFVEDLKRLGRKSGAGFYDYPEGGKKVLWSSLASEYPRLAQQR